MGRGTIPSLSLVTAKASWPPRPPSSSFPTAQSGYSIINLLEIQPSTALLSRGLTWPRERAAGRQMAQESQELEKDSLVRTGPQSHPLLDSRFSWRPWNKTFFPEGIFTISSLLPGSLKYPTQPLFLLNPRKSPTVPTALPRAKRDKVEARQVLGQQILTSSSLRQSGAPGHKRTEA